MKKLSLVLLSVSFMGQTYGLQNELVQLKSALDALGVVLKGEKLPPPPPKTAQEIEEERLFGQRTQEMLPPPPGELLPPPVPYVKGAILPPPPPVLPAGVKPKDVGPLPPPPFMPDVKPLPEPLEGVETEQEGPDTFTPPPPPPAPSKEELEDVQQKKKEAEAASTAFVPPVSLVAKPDFIANKSIKQDVLSALRKPLPSIHDENLSATIGITNDGSLVVWGPKLKVNNIQPDIFFNDGRQFMYPNADKTVFVMEKGKAKSEYMAYVLIDMPELKNQKKYFDQIRDQFIQVESRRGQIQDPTQAQTYIASLQNMILGIVDAFDKMPLIVPTVHTDLKDKDILSANQALQLATGLEALVNGLTRELSTELAAARATKQAKLAEWKSAGTPEHLLENRWQKAKPFTAVRAKLEQLSSILAQLQAIDLAQLKGLIARLEQQKDKPHVRELDAYYTTLRDENREQAPAQISSDEEEEGSSTEDGQLSRAEEEQMDRLKTDIAAQIDTWLNTKMSPLEQGQIQEKLRLYIILKRKEDSDWRPMKKLQQLYTIYNVTY